MSRKKTKKGREFWEKIEANRKSIEEAKVKKQYLDIRATGLDIILEENEKFKPCTGQPDYYVSNYGRFIKKKPNGKYTLLKTTVDKNCGVGKAYQRVYINGVLDYVNRIVAINWCKGYDAELRNEVHHIDHNGLNNRADNLMWVNSVQHGFLNHETTILYMGNRIDSQFIEVQDIVEIADKIGIDLRVMSFILRGDPDCRHNGLDIYVFDSGGKLPHIIALDRTGRQSA